MRALNRKLFRDLWRIKTQALAIALVIGCGVATVVMSFGILVSLTETRNAYYDRYRFADVFATVKRAPESLRRDIELVDGVQRAQTRIVADVTLDVPTIAEPVTGRLISHEVGTMAPLNELALRQGRLPKARASDEVTVNEAFAVAHGFRPGDEVTAILNGRKRTLKIVGIALSPEYVYAIGPGQLVPDDKRFAVLWMARDALEAAYDLDGAFNSVTLLLNRGASTAAVIERLDAILARYGGTGAIERRDQLSHSFLQSDLDQLTTIGRIIPPIFLAVAAFLLNMVIGRLVEIEREQIGLLKAFGYTNGEVGAHYLALVLAIATIGTLLGFVLGAWLGRELTELYARFYRFPFLHYQISTGVFAIAALVSVAAAVVGTLRVVWRVIALAPAVAMMPAAPTHYRQTVLDALGLLGAVSRMTRMIVRHITRWPLRAALTSVGVALSIAVMVGSIFALDAIDHMIDVYFFQAQRQDASLIFVEPRSAAAVYDAAHLPGVLRAEPFRQVAAEIQFAHRSERVAITGLDDAAALSRLLDAKLNTVTAPPRGLMLTTKLAAKLGAAAGQHVIVEAKEGRRHKAAVPVSAVVEEYIGISAYMHIDALNRFMGDGPVASGVHVKIDPSQAGRFYRALKETPSLAGVSIKSSAVRLFRETMNETMVTIISFYIMFGGLIAFGVIYNVARISLSERGRELASLRVLGFTKVEVGYILLGELALLTLAAIPIGCAGGYGLAWFMSSAMDTDLFRVPLIVKPATYGLAVATVLAAALASSVAVAVRINGLDLIAVLKTRE